LLAGLKTIILGADDETLGGRFNELLLEGLRMTDNADDDGEDIASRRLGSRYCRLKTGKPIRQIETLNADMLSQRR